MSGLIVVTRPEPDASDYADELKAQGYSVLVEPMLKIVSCDFEVPDMSDYHGVLLTSANAIRAFMDRVENFDLDFNIPVYCVGKHTAAAAQYAGFLNVISVDGIGADLLVYVLGLEDVQGKRFLHLCGDHVAFPLVERLKDKGVHSDALAVYRSKAVQEFSSEFIDALRNGDIEAVTFFSKRTAQVFVGLIAESDSESEICERLCGIKALSISQSVVECVRVLRWGVSYVSETPDRAGIMALLKAYVS